MAELGQTDAEIASFLGVALTTFKDWRAKVPELSTALKVGKDEVDDRVERSLYERAVGYNYPAVKIFMPANAEAPVYAEYTEHCPPDPRAAQIWLCNRRPDKWRNRQDHTHAGPDGESGIPVNVTFTVVKAPSYDDGDKE